MTDVQTLTENETSTSVTHEQEVKELFQRLTVPIPGADNLRAISLDGFKVAIDLMMNKAFYHGAQNSMQSVEDIMDRVFNSK